MRMFSVFFIFILFTQSVFANSHFSSAKIARLVVHDFDDRVLIETNITVNNSEGCTYNEQLSLLKTHKSFNEMYTALLSAFHANTTITGWVNGCDRIFKTPILTRLDLVKM